MEAEAAKAAIFVDGGGVGSGCATEWMLSTSRAAFYVSHKTDVTVKGQKIWKSRMTVRISENQLFYTHILRAQITNEAKMSQPFFHGRFRLVFFFFFFKSETRARGELCLFRQPCSLHLCLLVYVCIDDKTFVASPRVSCLVRTIPV